MSNYQPIKDAPRDGTWILLRARNSAYLPMVPIVASWRVGEGRAIKSLAWRESLTLRDVSYLANDRGADWAPLPD